MVTRNGKPASAPRGTRARRKKNRTLIELRLRQGLSTNDLAFRAEVSGPSVRLAERGHLPSPRVQFAIAKVLGVKDPLSIWPLETQKEFLDG